MADEFYGPRSRANARALLAAAETLGLDPGVVRTQAGGYLAPHEVVEIVVGVQDIQPDTEYEGEETGTEEQVADAQGGTEEGGVPGEPGTDDLKRPSQADSKADWLAYATAKSLNVTDDNTKAEIVKAVQDSEKEND